MKKLLTAGLVIGILVVSITAVYAFGPHFGGDAFATGHCMSYTNLTPEQKAKAEQFQKETLPVRQQLLAKHSELMTLKAQSTLDWKAIEQKKKEIVELRTQIEKRASELGVSDTCIGHGTYGGHGMMGMKRCGA